MIGYYLQLRLNGEIVRKIVFVVLLSVFRRVHLFVVHLAIPYPIHIHSPPTGIHRPHSLTVVINVCTCTGTYRYFPRTHARKLTTLNSTRKLLTNVFGTNQACEELRNATVL